MPLPKHCPSHKLEAGGGEEDQWRGQASAQACCDAYNAKESSVKASDRKALARKQSLLRKSGVLCGRYRPQGGAIVGSQEAVEPPRCAAAKKTRRRPLRSGVLDFALRRQLRLRADQRAAPP